MNLSEITARVGPLAQSLIEDEQVKARLRDASRAGRDAVKTATGRKKTKEPAAAVALRRASEAVRETGQALSALAGGAEKRREKPKRRVAGPLVVAGAGAAAAAAVYSLGSGADSNPKPQEATKHG